MSRTQIFIHAKIGVQFVARAINVLGRNIETSSYPIKENLYFNFSYLSDILYFSELFLDIKVQF